MQALQVDAELSPLVQRTFTLTTPENASVPFAESNGGAAQPNSGGGESTVLQTEYKATTNRMLRVAVNGFMESLGVVLGVMEELDVDVLEQEALGRPSG